ncbi:MAG TPA: hypothetical protein VK673_21895 [Chthoniobacterales bacterium]|nr:hypothetical protein [Chthoniobacterales bacterium]
MIEILMRDVDWQIVGSLAVGLLGFISLVVLSCIKARRRKVRCKGILRIYPK